MQQYVQQRDLQLREAEQAQADQPQAQPLQLQPSELRQQFKQWIDMQLARLPAAAAGEAEEPSKALVPQQPKRGNCECALPGAYGQLGPRDANSLTPCYPPVPDMALCHFKICNMGRKRSPRIQPQDLP